MSVLVSATAVRIGCDNCGEHVSSADLSLEALRRATGFVYDDGADYGSTCLIAKRILETFTRSLMSARVLGPTTRASAPSA